MKKWLPIIAGVFVIPIVLAIGALVAVGMFFNPASSLCNNSSVIAAQTILGGGQSAEQYFNQFAPGDRTDRQKIAQLIVSIGKSRGLSERTIKIAVATGIQESGLRNLPHRGELNDHDSLGVFQQRPSQGWGTPEQIGDPIYATNKFYDALTKVSDRDNTSRPLIDIAIQVQRPNPFYYHRDWAWDQIASEIVTGAKNNPNECSNASLASVSVGGAVKGDDYPHRGMPIYTQNPKGYYYRECVDFVAWRLSQQLPLGTPNSTYLGLGNAVTWRENLVARGYRADKTPAVGAVMWWGAFTGDETMRTGKYGHVAIVSEVLGNGSIVIEQYNAAPLNHAYSTKVIPPSYYDDPGISFIHVADIASS